MAQPATQSRTGTPSPDREALMRQGALEKARQKSRKEQNSPPQGEVLFDSGAQATQGSLPKIRNGTQSKSAASLRTQRVQASRANPVGDLNQATRKSTGRAGAPPALGARDLQSKATDRRELQAKQRIAQKNKKEKKEVSPAKDLAGEMTKQTQKYAGSLLIRAGWVWLSPSFGHSIHILNTFWFIGFMQRQIGFYLPIIIPEIGEEWFTEMQKIKGLKKGKKKGVVEKTGILVVKFFEITFIGLITLLVVAIDVFILAAIGILIMMAAKAANVPIVGNVFT